MPDHTLTPGRSRAISLHTICTTRWGLDKRFVTEAMKLQAYHRYGLTGPNDKRCTRDKHGRKCEIDHLVPRSLGGADHISNLWPQPYGSKPWNATRKDRLEVRLSKDVCAGKMSLAAARAALRRDYRVIYVKLYGQP